MGLVDVQSPASNMEALDAMRGGHAMSHMSLRPLAASEMGWLMEQAHAEGWNPGLHDAASFHIADPGGFFVAEQGCTRLGCISAVRYGSDFGFLGLCIVREPYRGQGVGLALWQKGMDWLQGRCVGLHGAPAHQVSYVRQGFSQAWRCQRFEGPARPAPQPVSRAVVPLGSVAFEELRLDDSHIFPGPREAFLRAWMSQPSATGRAWVAKGKLGGWGMARPCREGFKIAPLVADSPEIAQALIQALCAALPPGTRVMIDVPHANVAALALVRSLGMVPRFETMRMYSGRAPAVQSARLFALTSLELG